MEISIEYNLSKEREEINNMIQKLRARRAAILAAQGADAVESGFTLIELMVVVLIIAILMAIAIPTFLSSKNSAQQRGAQENVQNMISDLVSLNSNTSDYSTTGLTSSQVTNVDPTYTITDGTSLPSFTNANVDVFVEQSTATGANSWAFVLSKSSDGTWWCGVVYENYPSTFGVSANGQTPAVPAQGTSASGSSFDLLTGGTPEFPPAPASGSTTNIC